MKNCYLLRRFFFIAKIMSWKIAWEDIKRDETGDVVIYLFAELRTAVL